MPKKIDYIFILTYFTLIFAGCSNKKESNAKKDGKLTVYTTIFPILLISQRKIGGDYVNVEAIYPPGADSHTFEPSQNKQYKLQKPIYLFITALN